MAEILEHLTTKMAAVVAYKPHDYRFEERKVPRPALGEMLIRVKSTGICGSDIKRFTGAPLYWGDEHRPPSCQAPVYARATNLISYRIVTYSHLTPLDGRIAIVTGGARGIGLETAKALKENSTTVIFVQKYIASGLTLCSARHVA